MHEKLIHQKSFLKMLLSCRIFFIRSLESCIQRWLCKGNRNRTSKITLENMERLEMVEIIMQMEINKIIHLLVCFMRCLIYLINFKVKRKEKSRRLPEIFFKVITKRIKLKCLNIQLKIWIAYVLRFINKHQAHQEKAGTDNEKCTIEEN